MSDFAHLHVHSHYSLLDGLGRIQPMLEHVKEHGMTALALTDHGSMYGAIELVQTAQQLGIKPIVGVEAYLAPNGHEKKRGKIDSNPRHLTLLAQNNQGYKNLVKLTTHAHLHGYYYKPRIDYDLLQKHRDGLIVLSGCLNSDISRAITENRPDDAERLIKWHLDVFGPDHFFLEVQHHPNLAAQKVVNDALITYSQKFKVPLVATADSHYIHADDAEAHDVLICVQTGKTVNDKDRLYMLDEDFSLKSSAEMKKLWRDHPAALDNTQKIADMCNVELEFGTNRLPPFPLPPNTTADAHLRDKCLAGLKERYRELPPDAAVRLDYELDVIKKTGFASYFLIVSDFVNEAKNRGILVGPGRGSAAGSLVSYLTNITNIDPLAYNLLFERFLNPERVSMPDIDLDFADDRRDEVINYVRDKYGHEHVAQIITFGTMAARAAVRDAGRALGFPYTFCDQVAKAIPLMTNFEEALKTTEFRELYQGDPQAKKLIDTARKLEGVARHASTHAAGVVITDEPLTEYLPLQRSTTGTDDYDTVTQYAMHDVEALGLLKIDFLGLKNLTIIQNTLNRIKDRYQQDIDIDHLPPNDAKAYRLLQEGKSTGVFQLESAGMKRYLKELKPTELEDIISMVALYRPGPMDSIPDFINAKHGRKSITYLHPLLKPILEKTYGVIVTQDQVLQIAREFAGFSYAEADILRKAVGKKIKKLLDEQREKFITGAIETNQVDQKLATQVWNFIEPFARYGFNRCLTGDTRIVNPETGERIRLTDLHRDQSRLKETVSLNGQRKIYRNRITKVIYNGTKPVFEVQTRSGRRLRATANHPLLTTDGWQIIEDIKVGERIAVPRTMPEPAKPRHIPPYRLAVLGYLLAEGNLCHPHGFYFYSRSEDELADYCHHLSKFKNTQPTISRSKPAASVYSKRQNVHRPSAAVEWLHACGLHGKTATEKFFPPFVWQLSNRNLAVLLGKMFQGDGCISTKRATPEIYYATSSARLIEEFQELLLRFGVVSTIHQKTFKYRNQKKTGYTLSISRAANIQKFLAALAPHFVDQKKRAAEEIMATHPILAGRQRTWSARGSKDIVPVALATPALRGAVLARGMTFRQAARTYNFSERLLLYDKKKIGVLRETIDHIACALDDTTLHNIATSDVYWDEIVSITAAGHARTYDLSMEKDHNFIANNIFVHNSHAACYALIAYQTAYLKANYPAEFMAALLTSDEGNIDRAAVEVAEALSMGLKILPPDVNESFESFTVVKSEHDADAIRFGLGAVKNVGHNTVSAIITARRHQGPFADLADFAARVPAKEFNRKSLDSLTRAGALDRLGERQQILDNIEKILAFNRALHKQHEAGQQGLFGESLAAPKPRLTLDPAPAAAADLRLRWEKELLGMYVSEHPLSRYQTVIQQVATPIAELTNVARHQSVRTIGVISQIKKIITKSNQPMLFVQIEDIAADTEVLVFPNLLQKTTDIWVDGASIIVEGKLSDKDGQPKILADRVELLSDETLRQAQAKPRARRGSARPAISLAARLPDGQGTQSLTIQLPTSFTKQQVEQLKNMLARTNEAQGVPIHLHIRTNGSHTELPTPYRIEPTPEKLGPLIALVGRPAIKLR